MKKYKLTKETKEIYGKKLYRIEAVESFGSVSKGEKGGFVEKTENLDQSGNAWVYGNARVSGDAWVYGNVKAESGYYFAHIEKSWKVKEIKVDEDITVLWHE